ncbi:MAG: cyclic nucleotide-binding domain-containing protein [Pseudolabrys sp.]|nr:cyclic nucleotide-binding domain-containing protein [Pseudolabrys sp.]
MDVQNAWLVDLVNRALERASQNLTLDKLLTQLGLDTTHRTFEAALERLIDIALANINVANLCALVGAIFYAATLLMRTMVPLRVFGIISILFFIAYGALGGAIATLLMYVCLLPINGVRLLQMLNLVKKARVAAQGDMSMEWLKPFMDKRSYKKGQVLFRKDQRATEMLLIVTGKFKVVELDVELGPGRLMGELGFLTPDNKRTQTVECIENGEVLTIEYERLLEIYFQNPEFGYYFLRLTSNRLLENNKRLQALIEEGRSQQGGGVPPSPVAVSTSATDTPRQAPA